MSRYLRLSFALALLSTLPAQAQVIASPPPLTAQQENRLHDISARLRCLVCQGQSVADSNSDFSREVRRQIAIFLKEGRSDAEIEQFFSKRYGESVLLAPPKKGLGLLLWGLPLLALLAGTGIWWNVIHRKEEKEVSLERLNEIDRELKARSGSTP